MASRCLSRSCSQLVTSIPTSAARAFLQVAPRKCFHSTPPVLDFLFPSISISRLRAPKSTNSTNGHIVNPARRLTKRSFTISVKRQQTTVIHNPQTDDDGNEMHIEITPRASKRLKEIMAKDQNPNLALRIQVESGGCHGFQYLMSLTTLPPLPPSITEEITPALNTSSSDPNALPSATPGSPSVSAAAIKTSAATSQTEKAGVLEDDDTVFGTEDGEAGAKIVMNAPSLDLLKGSKVDYTMELIGSQFKIVDNPLATSSCGCGTSFDIKF